MLQCKGCCPGNSVVPREPATKGPSSTNLAGGSFQLAMSVRYFHANSGLTSASTECSNCNDTPLTITFYSGVSVVAHCLKPPPCGLVLIPVRRPNLCCPGANTLGIVFIALIFHIGNRRGATGEDVVGTRQRRGSVQPARNAPVQGRVASGLQATAQ